MTGPLLRIEGLRKSFGASEVLSGIDLEIEEGELAFIIGPSGAGKSTFLRCINRLESPSAGRIFFQGIEVTSRSIDLNKLRRSIGMVFQSFNLYPHMTAMGNVTLALRMALGKSRKEAQETGRRALAEVGLADKAQSYPHELSGGQQQRVAIARALALDPQIVLFDEPTSALDPELVGSVLAAMRDLKARGMTMLVVSHEMRFAREVAGRVIFMEHGRIIEQGTADEIFGRPKQERTRAFIGEFAR